MSVADRQRTAAAYLSGPDAVARGDAPTALAPKTEPAPVSAPPSPDEADDPSKPDASPDKKSGGSRLKWIGLAVASVVVIAGAIWGVNWWLAARHFESTDDAFVDGRPYSISPQLNGYVVSVAVTDNEHVSKGAPLVRIDDRVYQAALEQAKAQVAQADAGVANVSAQIDAQSAQIDLAKAQASQAVAAQSFSQQEKDRYATLAKGGNGTVETAQQWQSDLEQKRAGVAAAQSSVQAAIKQLAVLQTQKTNAAAALAVAKAAEAQAELNLSYTTILAAEDGTVVQLSAAPGEFAQAGQALMMFLPDAKWITANFKETQITDMKPGQPVSIEIDAYPGLKLRGHVASIQPGSGTAYSLLPPENATGNYVKITQRVPVKIALDDVPAGLVLGPGLSVVPYVKVR